MVQLSQFHTLSLLSDFLMNGIAFGRLETESHGNGGNLRWNLTQEMPSEAVRQQRRTNLPRFSSSRGGCLANMEWCQHKGKTATVLSKNQPFGWLFSWRFRLGYMDSRNPDVRNGFTKRQPPLKELSGIVMGLRMPTPFGLTEGVVRSNFRQAMQ